MLFFVVSALSDKKPNLTPVTWTFQSVLWMALSLAMATDCWNSTAWLVTSASIASASFGGGGRGSYFLPKNSCTFFGTVVY